MNVTVNPKTCLVQLEKLIKTNLVPMIHGAPSSSKSAVVRKLADKYNLKLIDIRLLLKERVDLVGYPKVSGDKATYLPFDVFPVEGDPLPEGYGGVLIFFDEFCDADRMTQAGATQIILDKMVGERKLHPNVKIVLAGNNVKDNASARPMPTQIQSRLVHLEMVFDAAETLQYIAQEQWDYRLQAYLNIRQNKMNTFNPKHNDFTYSCVRTLEFVNTIVKGEKDVAQWLPIICGSVSQGVGIEFVEYCKNYDRMPNLKDIEANPESFPMPKEPDIVCALASTLASHLNQKNITQFVLFINRMNVEYRILTSRMLYRESPDLFLSPEYIPVVDSVREYL